MKVTSATEASSVKLTREGQITKFTTGYVVDRTGNTGGLGAMFGILREWLSFMHAWRGAELRFLVVVFPWTP